jgi:hypothetical protein
MISRPPTYTQRETKIPKKKIKKSVPNHLFKELSSHEEEDF